MVTFFLLYVAVFLFRESLKTSVFRDNFAFKQYITELRIVVYFYKNKLREPLKIGNF